MFFNRLQVFVFFVLALLIGCEPTTITIPLPNAAQAVGELPQVSASAPVIGETSLENAVFQDTCGKEFVLSVSNISFLENGRTLLEFTLFNAEPGDMRLRPWNEAIYVTDEFGNRYDFVRSPYEVLTSETIFTVSAGTRETIWGELPQINEAATALYIRADTRCPLGSNYTALPNPMAIEFNTTFGQFRDSVVGVSPATEQ